MTTKAAVELFLKDFKEKMKFWDILFRDDRGKNMQTLIELELRPIDRKKMIEALDAKDYCEGPLQEKLYGARRCGYLAKRLNNAMCISK